MKVNHLITNECEYCKKEFESLDYYHRRFCSHSCGSKNRMLKYKNTIDVLNPSFELGYVLGAIYGDGSIMYDEKRTLYNIRFAVLDKEFRDILLENIKKVYPYLIDLKNMSRKGKIYYGLNIFSKDFCGILKNFSLNMMNQDMRRGFIVGIFDAEGSVGVYNLDKPTKVKRMISFTQKFGNVLNMVKEIIIGNGIKFYAWTRKGSGFNPKGRYLNLIITGKKNLILFKENFGFAIPRKRDKLELAINSYQKVKCERCGNISERASASQRYCYNCSKLIYPNLIRKEVNTV